MLDKKTFMTKMAQIAELKNLNPSEDYAKSMYALLKDDFTDSEFINICDYILKYEELYNKMPEPRHFYKHKQSKNIKQLSPEEIANSEFSAVLNEKETITNEITKRVLTIWKNNNNPLDWRLDPTNDNREEIKWIRKEFIELWLGIYDRPNVLLMEDQRRFIENNEDKEEPRNKTYLNKPQHIGNILKNLIPNNGGGCDGEF
jgi:hypothetical protein